MTQVSFPHEEHAAAEAGVPETDKMAFMAGVKKELESLIAHLQPDVLTSRELADLLADIASVAQEARELLEGECGG